MHHFWTGRKLTGRSKDTCMFLLRVTNYKEQAPLDQKPIAVSEEQGNVSHSSENNGRAEGGEWRAPGEGKCRGPQGRLGYHRMNEK